MLYLVSWISVMIGHPALIDLPFDPNWCSRPSFACARTPPKEHATRCPDSRNCSRALFVRSSWTCRRTSKKCVSQETIGTQW